MKVFDKKDVFSWANCEEVKQYIGKYCYFADKLGDLENQVKKDRSYKLQKASQLEIVHSVFLADDEFWGLCLPAEKVIEVEEKKYRPFKTCEEFCDALEIDGVGDCIHFRFKDEPTLNYFVIFNGYVKDEEDQLYSVCLGSYTFTIQHLFEHFEYSVEKGKWQPFGVEE